MENTMSSKLENESDNRSSEDNQQIKGGGYAAYVGVIMMGIVLVPMAIIMLLKIL